MLALVFAVLHLVGKLVPELMLLGGNAEFVLTRAQSVVVLLWCASMPVRLRMLCPGVSVATAITLRQLSVVPLLPPAAQVSLPWTLVVPLLDLLRASLG